MKAESPVKDSIVNSVPNGSLHTYMIYIICLSLRFPISWWMELHVSEMANLDLGTSRQTNGFVDAGRYILPVAKSLRIRAD